MTSQNISSTKKQPEQSGHCDHECVCGQFRYLPEIQRDKDNLSCNIFGCKHDTRLKNSHIQSQEIRKDCVCFTCENYGLADDCDPNCPTLKQHLAIARAATLAENERIIEDILGFIAGWGSLNYQIPKKYLKEKVESFRKLESLRHEKER
jgi:hypothetical protein